MALDGFIGVVEPVIVDPIPADFCGQVNFDIRTPGDEATLLEQIRRTNALGLPVAGSETKTLRIIASGPSARDAPLDGPTLALNGAIDLFFNTGRSPTYWAGCDPQALLADLLPDNPPMETAYLVASKCHPRVFEKLKGRDVRPFHVNDLVKEGRTVPCASSITSTAFALMLQLGWSKFDVWGWDCCFDGDQHHVGEQAYHFPETVTIECDGVPFKTTRSWAVEAEDFANKLKPIYDYLGIEITLNGDGYVKAYLAGSQAVIHFEDGPMKKILGG